MTVPGLSVISRDGRYPALIPGAGDVSLGVTFLCCANRFNVSVCLWTEEALRRRSSKKYAIVNQRFQAMSSVSVLPIFIFEEKSWSALTCAAFVEWNPCFSFTSQQVKQSRMTRKKDAINASWKKSNFHTLSVAFDRLKQKTNQV